MPSVNSARNSVEPPKIACSEVGLPPEASIPTTLVSTGRSSRTESRAAMSRPSWVAPMRIASGRFPPETWAATAAATLGPGSDSPMSPTSYTFVAP